MYHSIDFGGKNTWDAWHLIPTSRPVVPPPDPKTNTVEIPGASGSIDMSETLTGYPLYGDRTGSIDFIFVNDFYTLVDYHEDWADVYSDIMSHLHNKTMKMVLEDDPEYYYEGRFKVESWSSGDHYATVKIGYTVGPYKWFHNGRSKEFSATTTITGYQFTPRDDGIGLVPVTPIINVTAATEVGVEIQFENPTLGIDVTQVFKNGENEAPRMVLYGDSCVVRYKTTTGTATFSVDYKEGSL